MRALTLTQPWAGLVASGIKLVENRPRRMIKAADFGTPFAIHASRGLDEDVYQRARDIAPDLLAVKTARGDEAYRLGQIRSAVIAVATIDRCIRTDDAFSQRPPLDPDQQRWFFGPIGYVLRDVRALETPVPCRGFQGFWTLPHDVERRVTEQLKEPDRGM